MNPQEKGRGQAHRGKHNSVQDTGVEEGHRALPAGSKDSAVEP